MQLPEQHERVRRFAYWALQANEPELCLTVMHAVADDPARATWQDYALLGMALAKLKRFAEAQAALQQALQLEPQHLETACALAEVSLSLLDYPTAVAAIAQCIALDPHNTQPAGTRARALARKAQTRLERRS